MARFSLAHLRRTHAHQPIRIGRRLVGVCVRSFIDELESYRPASYLSTYLPTYTTTYLCLPLPISHPHPRREENPKNSSKKTPSAPLLTFFGFLRKLILCPLSMDALFLHCLPNYYSPVDHCQPFSFYEIQLEILQDVVI